MPTIEARACANGTTSYRVRWAEDGRQGTKPTVTFNTGEFVDAAGTARTFATLVKASGETMPTDDQLRAYGLGMLAAAAAPTGVVTVTDMCSSYIDHRERRLADGLEPDTIDLYRSYVRRYVEPLPLGNRALGDASLSFADIDAWQNQLLDAGSPRGRGPLSKNSVLAVRSQLLSPAFKWACGPDGNLRHAGNPMEYSKAPKKQRPAKRDRLWTPAEYALLVRHALDIGPEFGAMVATAAATGVRDGEYRQLRPEHALIGDRSLSVEERVTGARRVRPGTKNHTTRTVPVPDPIFQRLIVPRLDGRPHMFLGPGGGRWPYATERTRWVELRRRLAADGLRRHVTPHSLRHGYISFMTSHFGESKVAQLVGHEKESVTAGYVELSAADIARARDLASGLVSLPRARRTSR